MLAWITVLLLGVGNEAQKAADAHFNRGPQLAGRGDYVSSLSEFEEAYRLAPAWQVLFNLGVVHEKLAEPVQALEAFDAYLAQGGAAVPKDRRDVVNAELTALRKQVAEVVIKTEGPAMTVEVDGVERALTAPLYVLPGKHRITGRRGDGSTRADVDVHRGDRVVVALAIAERAPDEPRAEPEPNPVVVTPRPQPPPVAAVPISNTPTVVVEKPWYGRWYVWAAVGVIVVGAVTAVTVAETRPRYDVRVDVP